MILHLDADAFFASVEQAADSRLRGRAVAVGGMRRGVVASASYEARRCGVCSAMPVSQARRLCPGLVVVPGDFEKYEHFSRMMFSFARDLTPLVEEGSIDEGFADLRGIRSGSALEAAAFIRRAVRDSLRITLSEGVATNKLVSQIASKLHKPDALVEVPTGTEHEFLAPLEAKWLPGIGPKMAATLGRAGLKRIGQIAATDPHALALFAGSAARGLCEMARGIDPRPVLPDPPAAKSLGEQETFDADTTDEDFVLAKLRSMTDRLMAKVRAESRSIRTVEVHIRYSDFDDCRRSTSLDEPTDLEVELYPVLAQLLGKAWERRVGLRLAGVKLSGFYPAVFQCGLGLVDAGMDPARQRDLARTVDRVREQFGPTAVLRGHDLFLKQLGERASVPRRSRTGISGGPL